MTAKIVELRVVKDLPLSMIGVLDQLSACTVEWSTGERNEGIVILGLEDVSQGIETILNRLDRSQDKIDVAEHEIHYSSYVIT